MSPASRLHSLLALVVLGAAIAAAGAAARTGDDSSSRTVRKASATHASAARRAKAKTATRARRTSAAGLLANGAFEGSVSGWAGYNAKLSLVPNGVDGGDAARVSYAGSGTSFSLYPVPKPVASTGGGAVYAATGSVRSSTPGRRICLRVREWDGGTVVASAESCVTAASTWAPIPAVSYQARGAGHALDAYLYEWGPKAGESFDVDGLRLTAAQSDQLYDAGSPLNTPIPADAKADANSAVMVDRLVSEVNAKGFAVSAGKWTTSIYYADASTPRHDVPIALPDFHGAKLTGVPIPANAAVTPDSDAALTIIDRTTGCEFDLGRARKDADGSWSAWFANTILTSGGGVYPYSAGMRASGFASAAGRVTAEELAAGSIDHALTFTMYNTKAGGPVAPASGSDGWSTVAGAIPEGARLQLDPRLDLDSLGLAPWQKTIARALQRYGMFLADTSGAPALSAQANFSSAVDYPWGAADYAYLPPALVSHLRVLELGPQFTPTWKWVGTPCAALR